MTVNEILARFKSLGDDARRAHNTKAGAPENQFGVKHGDIRAIGKKWDPLESTCRHASLSIL